jgi:hypothetical protein
MSIGREEYEERYGEHVIRCNVHGGTHIDSCPICEEEDMADRETFTCVTCHYKSQEVEDFITVPILVEVPNEFGDSYLLCHTCYDNYIQESLVMTAMNKAERLSQAINTDYLH